MGVGHTFKLAPLGVYFGDGAGVKSKDPFFGGVGPDREWMPAMRCMHDWMQT
jgi:cholesterol oxidase